MRLVAGLALGIIAAGSTFAQDVISAHSGVVHYVEGRTFLNDNLVELKFGQLPPIKENQVFRTEEGRAEILLTPGAFLRMQENSSVRMVSTRLTDTRIELLSGIAMVECDDVPKDNSIMLVYKSNTMLITKHGLYKIAATPGSFQVFDGEAIVKGESGQLTLKSGKETALDGVLMAQSFDKKADEDDLYRWSSRRSAMLAKASVSSAMGLRNGYTNSSYGSASNGCYNNGYGSTGAGYGWQWNPMFGMCTFVPMRGIAYSPFGYGFYSPYAAYNYFYSPTYYNSGGSGSSAASSGFTPYSNSQLGYAASDGRMSSGASSAGFSGGAAAASSGGGAAAAAGGSSRGGGGASSGGGGGASHGR
jgi:hypothetical protein